MNLGEELRTTLSQEAAMQTIPRPDVTGLISGGVARRRRRNAQRLGVAAVALLVLGGGVYGAFQVDRDEIRNSDVVGEPTPSAEPTTAPPELPSDEGAFPLQPGTYRSLVGLTATGAPIEADLSVAGQGWQAGNFATLGDNDSTGGVGAYVPDALAAGSGCSGDEPTTDLGESPEALAGDLAALPRSTVLEPPTPGRALGRDVYRLRVRITDDCPSGQGYRVADSARGSRGISYSETPTTVIVDFLVVDLEGDAVVVDLWHQEGASQKLIDKLTRARDSITFVVGE